MLKPTSLNSPTSLVGRWTIAYEGLMFVTIRGAGHQIPLSFRNCCWRRGAEHFSYLYLPPSLASFFRCHSVCRYLALFTN
ncbi:hypothetical protein SOVF_091280 [Spinacia oleracea]|nr:hypothetical protein SOVF_091280 [Spinacia oleracea]